MKITVTHDDGTTQDITELVQIAYDVSTNSMDWGSGFLDIEETNGLILLAEACRFPDCEQNIAEVWRQRLEQMPKSSDSSLTAHRQWREHLNQIARDRGFDYWWDVKPTEEERIAFLAEARRSIRSEPQQ